CTAWSLHDTIALAKRGTPAGLIGTTAFQGLAVSEMGAQGVGALPLLVVEHPLGGERPDAIARRAQQAFEQLHALIAGSGTSDRDETTDRASGATAQADLPAPATITIPDDPIAILD